MSDTARLKELIAMREQYEFEIMRAERALRKASAICNDAEQTVKFLKGKLDEINGEIASIKSELCIYDNTQ